LERNRYAAPSKVIITQPSTANELWAVNLPINGAGNLFAEVNPVIGVYLKRTTEGMDESAVGMRRGV
jgi:hypothetical protein